ncbi:hypothetical protein [Psychrobacter sp. FDAARGOS_221]|uniref:hypothetical protein n=1 Tax=Psychrobacter sp. FDAARGOS_221 TaxID=1975705 RepID=UPI000BB56DC7|nr:hypothetical protein [Psychrobacter sp. FDAARGOS_221]PNK59539.1 hypothetical protein A6J60_000655 [Psychrobacter sp. FDAARGOS_221]
MFETKLNDFFKKISNDDSLDEWYLSQFIDRNVSTLSAQEAFHASNTVVCKIKSDIYSDNLYELLEILISLRIHSDTNEIPPILIDNPNLFEQIKSQRFESYIRVPVSKLESIFDFKLIK